MGRKNSFNPVQLKKDKSYEKLKYKDAILWCESGVGIDIDINNYIKMLKEEPLPNYFSDDDNFKIEKFVTKI